jgi:selenocysteine lyase/cysteine desulfurase
VQNQREHTGRVDWMPKVRSPRIARNLENPFSNRAKHPSPFRIHSKSAFDVHEEEFENAFAGYIGSTYAIGVNNGTTALHLAMLALGIGPGDEVIMPSYTFVSTANAFVLRGAKIVFADCNLQNPNLNTDDLEALITPKTKAILFSM